jgi:hypothetical protein
MTMLYRPGSWHGVSSATILEFWDDYITPNQLMNIKATRSGTNVVIGVTNFWGGWTAGADVTVPDNEWVQIWWCWEYSGIAGKRKVFAQVGKNGTPTLIGTHDENNPYLWVVKPGRFIYRWAGTPYAPPIEGRVAMLRPYIASTYANAQSQPSDFLWPTNERTIYKVTSPTDFANKVNDNQILGRYANATTTYANCPTAANKSAAYDSYVAGALNSLGDKAILPAGDVDIGSVAMLGQGIGIELTSAGSTRILLGDTMSGSWTQPDAAGASKVWQFIGTNVTNRVPWIVNGVNFTPFICTVGASFAAVKAALQAKEYSYYTTSAGATYICLPTGTNPNTLTFKGSKAIPNFDLTGMFCKGNIEVTLGTLIDCTDTNAYGRVIQNNPVITYASMLKVFTIIDGWTFSHYSKHALTATGASDGGAVFRRNVTYQYGPPALTGVGQEYGIYFTGAASSDVDYSSIASSPGSPGEMVAIYDSPIVNNVAIAIEGTNGGRALAAGELGWYGHGDGTKAYTLIRFINCPLAFFGGTLPTVPNGLAVSMVFV